MVVVKLIGGLGNQLFQYAAGRRLALVHGAELKLDVTGLGNSEFRTVRHYELAPFNILQTFASPKDISKYTQPNSGILTRLFHRFTRKSMKLPESYIKEAHYHFDPRILDLPDDVYLDGYWQSERYFSDAAETIRKEVTVKAPLNGRNAELARQIEKCQAVSLHVRRGDYVTEPITNQVHGICGLDYYSRAVAYISSRLKDPVFFVFSDDPAWVREHLALPYSLHFVDHNGAAHGFEDLRLMSLCRHHIVANSSFSWWGAWLNPCPDKIVVAPKRWFNHYDADTRDLCPEGWVRL
jgi:Glycosyl transferase family 11